MLYMLSHIPADRGRPTRRLGWIIGGQALTGVFPFPENLRRACLYSFCVTVF